MQPKKPVRMESAIIRHGDTIELDLANSEADDATLLLILGDPKKYRITKIDLSYTSISKHSFYKISQLMMLNMLNLKATNILAEDLQVLSCLSSLTSIDLSDCKTLRGDLMLALRLYLGKLPLEAIRLENLREDCPLALKHLLPSSDGIIFGSLKRLSISNSYLDVQDICGLPLEALHIANIKPIRIRTHKVTRADFLEFTAPISEPGKYFTINNDNQPGFYACIRASHPDPKVVIAASAHEKHYHLQIIEDYNQPVEFIPSLVSAHKILDPVPCWPGQPMISTASLIQLDLSDNQLRDYQLECLMHLKSLTALRLENNPVTARCLKYIAKLPLIELSMRDTFLGDDGEINFPLSLKRIYLDGSQITGKCLPSLFRMPEMTSLYLLRLSLTEEALLSIYTCPRNIKIMVDAKHKTWLLKQPTKRGAASIKFK